MGILKSIWRFFVPRERTLIFTSFNSDEFVRMKNKLIQSGIPHRSKITNWANDHGGGLQPRRMQYDIYVASEDENNAVGTADAK
ncbi:hypothetical protein GRF59_08000 [Paenibacillus sp. HJL G12]|uniref:DUF2007 domain-containing protein n=1 Tax=Paenibacillus dendrobii TaxID=2691084 RepID=A0A7X3IHS5_9BACL|nr:hypothetical protein [Paenibacillus dendrobii]MWV43576.1 hypothetical protein [Paenibacillus dendrobii]